MNTDPNVKSNPSAPAQAQAINAVLKQASATQLNKPGFQTTEFYITTLFGIATAAGIHTGKIPGETGVVLLFSTFVIYFAGRSVLKTLAAKYPATAPVIARLETDAAALAPVVQELAPVAEQAIAAAAKAHAQ